MGSVIHHCEPVDDLNVEGEKLAERLSEEGRKVYFFPAGGSSPVGTLGYTSCASEILSQAGVMDRRIDHIVVASGSQGT